MHHQHHGGKMMWLMMLACALPLLVSVVIGGRNGASLWILLGLGFMFALHWLAMRPSRKHDEHREGKDMK